MEKSNFNTTFAVSQRGAKSRTRIRQVLKRVQDEAEIIPNEPGQVMLPREAIIAIRLLTVALKKFQMATKINFNLE